MTRRLAAIGLVFVFVLAVSSILSAQERPNFSGRWTPVSPDGSSQVVVVVQDSTSIAAEMTDGAMTERLRFTFAGTTRQDVTHPGVDVVSAGSWKDGVLSVTSTFTSLKDNAVLSVREETWSLDAGGRLVIDVTTRRPNGQTATSSLVLRRM